MVPQLLITIIILFFFFFLRGVTLTLMLEINENLFSIAQCSMSDSKLV
jgi:hypothetical protein